MIIFRPWKFLLTLSAWSRLGTSYLRAIPWFCGQNILIFLSESFSFFVKYSCYPFQWLTSAAKSVCKTGSHPDPSNYRQVGPAQVYPKKSWDWSRQSLLIIHLPKIPPTNVSIAFRKPSLAQAVWLIFWILQTHPRMMVGQWPRSLWTWLSLDRVSLSISLSQIRFWGTAGQHHCWTAPYIASCNQTVNVENFILSPLLELVWWFWGVFWAY